MNILLRLSFIVINHIITCSSDNKCVLENGKCSYNVYLSHSNCDGGQVSGPKQELNYEQKDSTVVSSMQKDFNVVKRDHEDRIRELEASVQKMLRSSISGPIQQYPLNSVNGQQYLQGMPGLNSTEIKLLTGLQDQFSKLRSGIKEKTQKMLNLERRLNDTLNALTQAHDDLFETSEKLIIAEHKTTSMKQESYILKNQIKSKSKTLKQALEKVNITDAKVLQLERQLYELVRSESKLKEELGLFQIKLNDSIKAYKKLEKNNTVLKIKLSKAKLEVQRANLDLMECITAKTQTFCGFEDDDLCGFTQEKVTDNFDWKRQKGKTPSTGTGPLSDHTCRTEDAGHYMYIEASEQGHSQKAALYSPFYQSLNPLCVSFYYHMFGRQIGTLNVYTKQTIGIPMGTNCAALVADLFLYSYEAEFMQEQRRKGNKNLASKFKVQTRRGEVIESAWRAFGNQGNVWIQALLDIPRNLARAGFQLVFEAITVGGYLGDMSIDDVSVKDGKCYSNTVQVVSVSANVTSARNAGLRRLQKFKKFRQQLRRRNRNN